MTHRRTALAAWIGLVIALAPVGAQRTSVSGDFPTYDNGGTPDLTVDPRRFSSQIEIVDRLFQPNDCNVVEGSVGGSGYRRLLRFDTVVMNAGNGDWSIGAPQSLGYWFQFSPCHGHYHLKGFSAYSLLALDRSLVVAGHKQGFCLEDSLKYDGGPSHGYDCQYQGITSGWGDWYYKQLDGQWIDVTGVPAGTYIVRVDINLPNAEGNRLLPGEGLDRYPDFVEARVTLPDPRKKIAN